MARDAELTRQRLLEAATVEFAALGIAGARVDRIADTAGCNKAMIYAYFGNKDQLFDAVFTASVAGVLEQVPFDAHDLPGYAGGLFDHFERHPETLRLATWFQLERAHLTTLEATDVSNDVKLSGIADAQKAGALPTHFTPVQLLSFVRSIATSWAALSHSTLAAASTVSRADRRASIVDAVERLIAR